jgi:hypothetical protein
MTEWKGIDKALPLSVVRIEVEKRLIPASR